MTDHLPTPSVRPSRSSRADLQGTVVASVVAFAIFVVPILTTTIGRLSHGMTIVSVKPSGDGGTAGPLAGGGVRADAAVSVADLSAVVASLLIAADLLTVLLWTAVLALTAAAALVALRGGLFSRGFDALLWWLVVSAMAAAIVPNALRYLGTNGAIAQQEWTGAETAAFSNMWIPIILATTLTLVIVIHRSGRRLAEDQAGTV